MDNKKISSFTGLRFLMMIVIVWVHCDFLCNLDMFGNTYKLYLSNATFAVDFFFILSGFGMMYSNIIKVNKDDIERPCFTDCFLYGIKHIKKIYPVYIITIIIGFLGRMAYAFLDSKLNLKYFFISIFKILINIPLLQSATGMSSIIHAFNGVAWFLSSLFCIYIISPLLIYFLRKKSTMLIFDFIMLFIDIIFLILITIIFNKIEVTLQNKNICMDSLIYASPYRRVFYVLIGMSLAQIYNKIFDNKNQPLTKLLASVLEIFISIIAILYSILRNTLLPNQIYYIYVIDVILCSFFILIFSFNSGICSFFLSKKYMQKLGNISMYIFLIHYQIRDYLGWLINKIIGWNYVSSICFTIFLYSSSIIISLFVSKKLDGNKL